MWMLWQQKEETLAETYESYKNDLCTVVKVNSFGAPQEWKYH